MATNELTGVGLGATPDQTGVGGVQAPIIVDPQRPQDAFASYSLHILAYQSQINNAPFDSSPATLMSADLRAVVAEYGKLPPEQRHAVTIHLKTIFDAAAKTRVSIADSDIMLDTFLHVIESQPELIEAALPWAQELVSNGGRMRIDALIAASRKIPSEYPLQVLKLLSVCRSSDAQALTDGDDRGETARRLVRTISEAVDRYTKVPPDKRSDPFLHDELLSFFYEVARVDPSLPSQWTILGEAFEQILTNHPELANMASTWAKSLAASKETDRVLKVAQTLSPKYPEVSLDFITSVVNADLTKVSDGKRGVQASIPRLKHALTLSTRIITDAADDMQTTLRADVFAIIKRVYSAIPKNSEQRELFQQVATECTEPDQLLMEALARLAKT